MAVFTDEGYLYHIHVKKGDVGRYVILPGDPFRTDLIASFLDDAKLVAHNREHKTWTGYLNGEKVSVTSTGMGCPSTAICVEELIAAGADTFIRVGTAGRVCDNAQDPELDGCICSAAVRDEGTSLEYVPVEYPAIADRNVVNALVKSAKDNNKNFVEGITHCKDSFYGQVDPDSMPVSFELKERWETWKKANVMSAEMETSIIYVLASIRGKRAGSIMNWKKMEDTIQVAIDAIKLLIEEDKK